MNDQEEIIKEEVEDLEYGELMSLYYHQERHLQVGMEAVKQHFIDESVQFIKDFQHT